ncbi:MMPL family transporter [Rhodovastum atsumiense]|uniref:MMPL family transporter n=1 Tax=Rhodovastum atsumiense TaxID=504468 RepID=A0A5M6IY27_9PROT|nr:MMPL family transporter [Rhodovastum atsumiense]KAA5613250.1 MMPL family transporter [Rhodovastum atsumiense]CAH2600592.1 MMPL family transporter [Rhodovastum atsumiense]
MSLSRLLATFAEGCRRRAILVLVGALLLTTLSGWLAATRLGVTTDTDTLFASSLPWRQRAMAMDRAFPQFTDLLVAVVDAAIPEQAEQTAAALAQALSSDTTHFRSVRQPDASPYFDANGLMFLDEATLNELMERTIDAQPFLGQLIADPSARGLFAALGLLGMGVDRGQADLAPVRSALEAFRRTLADAAAGKPRPLSWQTLLGGKLVDLAGQYRFVLVQPKLDHGALAPGGAATDAIRAAAAQLPWVKAGQAHVRITGSVALADEEFATVAEGAVAGMIGSMLLVTLWLVLAVRSWRLIVPILLTLGLGLALTTGFAALVVGTLNLVSVAFAILFVGIAVDFAIQFCVRYREMRLQAGEPVAALQMTAARVGPQILVAAAATAAGFLAFVPTDFSGVAELGLIAGAGMVIAFACTLGFLPAALALFRPRGEQAEIGFAWAGLLETQLVRRRGPVLAIFAALAVAGAVLLPRLAFDSDPLHTKNPHTEAMRTLSDLMESPLTNPYTIDIIAPSQAEADALAVKLRKLPLVEDALTLSSLVPENQPAKLAVIADAASILTATLAPRSPAAPVSAADLRLAAKAALSNLERAAAKAPDTPVPGIVEALRRLVAAPDPVLLETDAALTRYLPLQLGRLRTALDAKPVTLASIPQDIARDWRLPDGRARVQVLPRAQARDSVGLHAFVAEVQGIAPEAAGSAVTIVGSATTIVGAFRSAALLALGAIAIILALVLRRVIDVLLVMAPLLLAALMTVVGATVWQLPLNFANIIALPLLLGVGVSFNIYFVMNWRAGADRFLGTATARAIIFSALTTGTAFGSLALSAHPGTASMGDLLMLSLGCTLIATLLFVPTLLRALNLWSRGSR